MPATQIASSSTKFLYVLPDFIAFLFIVLLPTLYRTVIDRKISEQIKHLGLISQRTEALALANFHQDLSLLTTSTIVLLFGAVKFMQVLQVRGTQIESGMASFSAVLLTVALLGFLVAAHLNSKATDYRDVQTTSGKNIFFGLPPFEKMRVAGVWGRWVFWGRFLFAGSNLVISIIAIW